LDKDSLEMAFMKNNDLQEWNLKQVQLYLILELALK